MDIPRIDSVRDFTGKRVLVRVDFNVPIENGVVLNQFRIKAALPTIKLLQQGGAKVILISHMAGRQARDLKPVSDALGLHMPHSYVPGTDPVVIREHISLMENGDVCLLANLRFWHGEEANEAQFAIDFSRLADLYVNEAFSASHREHASIVRIPALLPSYAGLNFMKEIENLSKVFDPPQPFLVIFGGAKFETKLPLIDKFLSTASGVFVGGALANDVFAARGFTVGRSLLSHPRVEIPQNILTNEKILLPVDVVVETENRERVVKKPEEVATGDRMIDAGPQSVVMLKEYCEKAKLILWNGPLGVYEEGAVKQTEELAIVVAESQGTSIVGGGDSVAAISRLELESAFDFVSTGGGAMLDFLIKETSPGIEALKK